MERNRQRLSFKILNPGNLQKEIHLYGYDFEVKNYLFSVIVLVFVSLILGKFLFLEKVYIGIILVLFLLALPFFTCNLFRIMYEQKRFTDVKSYMENILYAFIKRKGKILAALEDVEELYSEGELKRGISEAAAYIRNGSYDHNLYQEALGKIEVRYPNKRLEAVHLFMIGVEFSGGDFKDSAELMIADNQEWEYHVSALQQAKKAKLSGVYGAMLMGMICCIVALTLQQNYLPEEMGIAKLLITQITSTGLVAGEILVALYAQTKLTCDWLAVEETEPEKKVMQDYRYLLDYNVKKERLESVLWAAPFLAGALVVLVFWHKFYVSAGLLFAGYLMLHQHRLNYKITYDITMKRIKAAFPQWITRLTLLLQTNNVQVAIGKSIDSAPAILVPELRDMLERITENPHDINSYLSFLDRFNLPEIRNAMQILYAIAETGNGDITMQLNSLTATNMKLKSEAEKLKNEAVIADMDLLEGAPMVVCAVKQFSDLAVFMIYALPAMSNMY